MPSKGGIEEKMTETKSNKSKATLDMKTLFVRSIPEDVTDEQLTDFFSNFAPIRHAVVVKDVNKNSRGFGFVSFAVEEDTQEALKRARKTPLNGAILKVDIAKRRDRNNKTNINQSTESDDHHEEENIDVEDLKGKPKLIIRNIPWSLRDPNRLKKIFGRYGTVVEATIPRKSDGKMRGFAFVTMKRINNCKIALENTKDLEIDGRKVAVDFAIKKNLWEDYKEKHVEASEDRDLESKNSETALDQVKDVENENDGNDSNDQTDSSSDDEMSGLTEVQPTHRAIKEPLNKREEYSAFIRNVPYDATAESLKEHFEKFGPVKYVLPVMDKESGLAKGTAFAVFRNKEAYEFCIKNSPALGSSTLLVDDDILPQYVYEGRVLTATPVVKREDAEKLTEYNARKRKEALGKAPDERDRRNVYLLNEGVINENSKLASVMNPTDMAVRKKSYDLRVEQLKKNPSLHLSMTRLAVRNIPRVMTEKSLKALARKAVVEFASEVKQNKRHPLSKEEINRSTKEKYKFMSPEDIASEKKKDKKNGVVRQSKIIMEVKGSAAGRSRGYGFVEYKDHKHALMGLRWLNAHLVTNEEIFDGLTDQERKQIKLDENKGRRLVVEFAIENANVVKRRREQIKNARESSKRKHEEEKEMERALKKNKPNDAQAKDDLRKIIGKKRKQNKMKRQ